MIATTRPHRCACIAGTAALHIAIVESALSSNASVYASTSSMLAKSPAGGPPALGTRMSMPPSASVGRLDESGRTRHRADVGDERDAAVADLRRRGLDRRPVPAADRDLHAFGGQRAAAARSQAPRCRGDGGAASFDSEIHEHSLLAYVLLASGRVVLDGATRVRSPSAPVPAAGCPAARRTSPRSRCRGSRPRS